MKKNKPKVRRAVLDAAVTLLSLCVTGMVCVLLRSFSDGDTYVPLLFVLCVLVVSRFTNGYICGIAAALIAVLGVNYVFTYPYMELNFSISGYPLTFFTMLAVAVSTSTLTTHIKEQEKLKLETEREKMRANLLRAVSHDLRTPLTSISGSIGLALDDPEMSPEGQRILLQEAREDADWLIRMAENLLSVTRIGEGETKIEKTPEAAEEIAAEAARKFRKNYQEVELSVTAPDEVLFVPMDAVLIEQVLTNLLENAVIHGGNTKHVSLDVRRDGNMAAFSVTDDGAGISREAQQRMFTDYFDLAQQSCRGREKRNMGIGLSVCMTIVKAHGGNIRAENLPSGGARFEFTLPLD